MYVLRYDSTFNEHSIKTFLLKKKKIYEQSIWFSTPDQPWCLFIKNLRAIYIHVIIALLYILAPAAS